MKNCFPLCFLTGSFLFFSSLTVQASIPQKKMDSPSAAVLEILNLPSQNRSHVASQQGESFYKELVRLSFAASQPMSMRWKALTLAAQVGKEKSIPDLERASRDSLWYMRNAALLAMNEVNKMEAMEMAKKLIKDKALVVRSAAAEVLSQSKSPAVRDLFWEEFYQDYNKKKNQSLWIRGQILGYLSQQPLPHEKSMFGSLLKDRDLQVQVASVKALEKITGQSLGSSNVTWAQKISLWQSEILKK